MFTGNKLILYCIQSKKHQILYITVLLSTENMKRTYHEYKNIQKLLVKNTKILYYLRYIHSLKLSLDI